MNRLNKFFFYLLQNKTCYALQLKKKFQSTLSPMQQALLRLEKGGILVSALVGKTRVFQFNPRYLFLEELRSLLQSVYETLPAEIKKKYYATLDRKRPHRTGKPLP